MAAKLTLDDLKKAIKADINLQYLQDHFHISQRPVESITDKQVMNTGPLSTDLARTLNRPKQSVYAALNREYQKGNLMKDARPGTICRWWYEGLLEEIRPLIMDVERAGEGRSHE